MLQYLCVALSMDKHNAVLKQQLALLLNSTTLGMLTRCAVRAEELRSRPRHCELGRAGDFGLDSLRRCATAVSLFHEFAASMGAWEQWRERKRKMFKNEKCGLKMWRGIRR